QCRVVGDPVQRGVGEDDVDGPGGCPGPQIAELEGHTVAGVRLRPVQHRLGRVDADGALDAEVAVEVDGERAVPAAQVDSGPAGDGMEEGEEVVEGPPALVGEAVVLVGVPGLGAHGVSIQVKYK